jgi:hypothetical protein
VKGRIQNTSAVATTAKKQLEGPETPAWILPQDHKSSIASLIFSSYQHFLNYKEPHLDGTQWEIVDSAGTVHDRLDIFDANYIPAVTAALTENRSAQRRARFEKNQLITHSRCIAVYAASSI